MMQPLRANPTRFLLLPVLATAVAFAGCHASLGPQPVGPHRRIESGRTISPLERGFDVVGYAVQLDVDPIGRRVEGTVQVTYTVDADLLEALTFDLSGLELYGALNEDGSRLAARQEGDVVTVDLPESQVEGERGTIHMRYGGQPTRGLAFLGTRFDGAPESIFTTGGPESARGWFPCVDHPYERAATELTLTVPAEWEIVASGERVEGRSDGAGQSQTWRLAVPHAAHRFGFAAGRLVKVDARDTERPINRIAPQSIAADVAASLAATTVTIPSFERLFGTAFPFASFSQAVVEGLPTDTIAFASLVLHDASLIGDGRSRADTRADLEVARGVAAQWAGGLLEGAGWGDVWVTEGLADYAALLWLEETSGQGAFAEALRGRQNAAVASGDALPLSSHGGVEAADRYANAFIERASTRMHFLRTTLGDRAFRGAIGTFMNEFANFPKSTEDFLETLERSSGEDLQAFREDWVDSVGNPQLDVSWHFQQRRNLAVIDVKQLQPSSGAWPRNFRAGVIIEIRDGHGTSLHPVQLNDRRERFELETNGGEAIAVRFDTLDTLPKHVQRKWDGPECLTLARRTNDAAARHDACVELAGIALEASGAGVRGVSTYLAELADRLERDPSSWVRAAAATSLGQIATPESRQRLMVAVEADADARVRAAALRALAPERPDATLADFGRRIFETGTSWGTMGGAAVLAAKADPQGSLDWLEEVLRVPSSRDRLSVGVLDALATIDSPRVRMLMADVMDDIRRATEVRAHAAMLLASQRFERDDNARAIAELLQSDTPRLRGAAVAALASMGLGTARRALEAYYPESFSASERRVIEASLGSRRPQSRPAARVRYPQASR